jgi:hypothetical protein
MVFVLVGRVCARIGRDRLVWHWRHWLTEPEPEKLNRMANISSNCGKSRPCAMVSSAERLHASIPFLGIQASGRLSMRYYDALQFRLSCEQDNPKISFHLLALKYDTYHSST